MRGMRGLTGALRRQWRLASGVFLGVQLLVVAVLALMPRTWHVEAVLLAQPDQRMRPLANPNQEDPSKREPPTWGASSLVLSHANLVAIVDETDLLRRWKQDRGPLRVAIDGAQSLLRGPVSEKDRRAALEDLLRDRLYVREGKDGTVVIGIEWPGPVTAHLLVEAAQQKFLETRRAREVQPIADVIAILERHAAGTGAALRVAEAELAAVEARAGIGRAEARAERPPLPGLRAASPESTALADARSRLDALEQAGRVRREELLSTLRTAQTIYSPSHPAVRELERTIAALDQVPPEVASLRARIASASAGEADEDDAPFGLEDDVLGAPRASTRRPETARRESMRRPGPLGSETRAGEIRREGLDPREELQPDLPSELREVERTRRDQARARRDDDPRLVLARERLDMALTSHERLVRRIESARVELDVARAAFGYRYTILLPAESPATPARPPPVPVILGGLLLGAGLAIFSAVATDRPATSPAQAARRRRRVIAASAALAVTTVGILSLGKAPALALAPAALALLGWAVVRAPARHTLAVLLFLMLFLEAPGDSGNKWRSPWYLLGHLLNSNLNLTIPIQSLRFAGIDVVMLLLGVLVVWRRMAGDREDTRGAVPAPRPLIVALLVSGVAMAVLVATGLSRGGDFAQVLWQLHVSAMMLAMTLLFLAVVRGPQDFRALGIAILAAALAKAVQAVYIRWSLGLDTEQLATATSHQDSMLFATAFCMLVALALLAPSRRNLRRLLLCAPVLLAAMVTNNRRLVWVEIGAALVVFYVLTPRSPAKRFVQRVLVLSAPVLVLYVALGWNARSPIFSPVAKVRSVLDSSVNRSTMERDVENYNLIRNLQDNPVLGMGFGREYHQYVRADDISHVFPQWRFIPHNSLLGLLAFAGVLGFTAIWGFLTVGLYMAGRGLRATTDPVLRAAALTSIGAVLIYLLQCFGDMALVSWHAVFLIGPAMAVSGKLATATGAWPVARTRRTPGPLLAGAASQAGSAE